ncbi:MAG TPA: hypothetical protein VEL31_14920 [Ktedonobacteraceae bacterium]|nr:hypothetical protein [Ktedonobacteraceae bacterium]
MSQPSLSSETNNEPKQPKPWLLKHYQEKRQRTVTLVKAAVDHLANEQQTVTIEAICRTSSTLDPEGRGVKKSAVLENPEAHAYYRKHSTSYQTMKQRNRKPRRKPSAPDPLRIDPNRDVDRARYRYQHMTNAELVERLLIVEQAYAEVHQQLTQLQFEMLETQQQRAHRRKGEKERGDSISAAQQP